MNDVLQVLKERFSMEPYARSLGIEIVKLEPGQATVKMLTQESMNNIFGSTHGAAIYSLLDAAFELTVNSHGTVAVALEVNVNYLSAVNPGEVLIAKGREVSRSRRISACEIQITGEDGRLVANCQALAYRKKDPLPFL
ncbi:MAG: PaaI family thioesterase [Methanothrix sp.]|nr:PaaI family thioesterase [Methanothrix sp.]